MKKLRLREVAPPSQDLTARKRQSDFRVVLLVTMLCTAQVTETVPEELEIAWVLPELVQQTR